MLAVAACELCYSGAVVAEFGANFVRRCQAVPVQNHSKALSSSVMIVCQLQFPPPNTPKMLISYVGRSVSCVNEVNARVSYKNHNLFVGDTLVKTVLSGPASLLSLFKTLAPHSFTILMSFTYKFNICEVGS